LPGPSVVKAKEDPRIEYPEPHLRKVLRDLLKSIFNVTRGKSQKRQGEVLQSDQERRQFKNGDVNDWRKTIPVNFGWQKTRRPIQVSLEFRTALERIKILWLILQSKGGSQTVGAAIVW
jgi:hypothetical protein